MLNNQEPDEDLTIDIQDYLFNCQNWTFYELSLFNNYLEFFSIEYIEQMISTAYDKSKKYSALDSNHNIAAILHLNIFYLLLKHNSLESIPLIVNQLNEILSTDTYFFELNRLNHLQGIYHIKLGHFAYGKKLCKKSMEILEHFDNQSHLKNHTEELIEFFGPDFNLEEL